MPTIDTSKLTARNAAIVTALLAAARDHRNPAGQVTIDTLRRKLQTTKANIIEALIELTGAYEEIEFDAEGQVAMIEVLQSPDDVRDELGNPLHHSAYELDNGEDDAESGGDEEEENGDDTEDEQEEEEKLTKFRFPERKKAEYEEKGGHCGDELAEVLTAHLNVSHEVPRKDGKGTKKIRGIDLAACEHTAEANGIAWTKVKGNNPGQIRMNLSNMLRAKWRKGTDIRVGEATIRGLTSYKSRKQWIAECAAEYQAETKCTAAMAIANAEAEFEAKAAGSEYRPDLGTFS